MPRSQEQPKQEQLESFGRLWTEAEPLLKMYLNGAVFQREDAKDLLQKTALCAFRKFSGYAPGCPFRSWALGIARYEVLAYLRDRGRHPEMVNSELAEQQAGRVEDSAAEIADFQNRQAALVRQAVADLPSLHRRMLMMRYQDGLSYEEIASRLQMLPGTVRTALYRIRESLKAAVAKLENEDA